MAIQRDERPDIADAWHNIRATLRMIATTCGLGGLQFVWSLLQSSLTPFLLSLGFSKSACALVWSISPLCGALIQPPLGRWSDSYRHPILDRRRPFMIAGALIISISLMALSVSEESVAGLLQTLGLHSLEPYANTLAQIWAVSWFLLVNVGIQPLQVCSRAYIVENCYPGSQVLANAWATRVQGVCAISGFFLASSTLGGNSDEVGQRHSFTLLCIITSALLFPMVGIACYFGAPDESDTLAGAEFAKAAQNRRRKSLLAEIRDMPQLIRSVYFVQWFVWMGWFPYMAYFASYVNALGAEEQTSSAGSSSMKSATASGPFAGLLFSIVALISTCIFPTLLEWLENLIPSRTVNRLVRWKSSPTLVVMAGMWIGAQIYFVIAVEMTFVIHSQYASIALIAAIGIPWMLSNWLPFCLLTMVLDSAPNGEPGPEVGTTMGVHNAVISGSQILSALISAAVLQVVPGGQGSVVWAVRLSGLWMSLAALLCGWLSVKGYFRLS